MAIALDGFDALLRIGQHRRIFADARADADKAARAIVVKCLKAKALDLNALRALQTALGDEAFALIAHDLKPAEMSGLLKRLDKYDADLKVATPAQCAQHLVALAQGRAEPADVPEKIKAKKVAQQRVPKRLESAVMRAFAKAGRPED